MISSGSTGCEAAELVLNLCPHALELCVTLIQLRYAELSEKLAYKNNDNSRESAEVAAINTMSGRALQEILHGASLYLPQIKAAVHMFGEQVNSRQSLCVGGRGGASSGGGVRGGGA